MSEQQPPKIEFPCDNYRISVMGVADEGFHKFVLEVVRRHAPDHDGQYTVRDSSKGRFVAIVVAIRATGEEQLRALHNDLKANKNVRMVL
ncbi:YbeD family protein [Sansalvadorimonas verongulae]|uniref:YbeD family protein n=1 Tax=Sansalvadorimonas verongulae TaxID=2172824 RepID=UPI0012BCBEF5|nr:DUF493 domain-containing protein [Sansalvadorimonas verongulae]MTI14717.1 DUF493 family protein [Sansalvadorimonas verongulae]